MESFKLFYDGDNSVMKYFSEHPVSEWFYFEFEAAINSNNPIKPNNIKTKSAYLNAIKSIKNNYDIPEDMETEIGRLLAEDSKKPSSITFNITAKDSSTINGITNGPITQNLQPQQPQPQQDSQPQPQPQDESENYDSEEDENKNYDSDEDETRIPSDLSIDHHPRRINDYSLSFQEGSTQLEEDTSNNDSKWIINNQCISDLCFGLKKATIQIAKQINSAQLSDSRLLVLNDIYLFDKTPALSVSKYFTLAIHDTIKSTLSFEAYFPPRGIQCYEWCMNIEASSPSDWLSSLKLCGKMITDACESNNLLDIHTAQVLTHVLPIFINDPPDNSIEDSYVHNYLSPLLTTVFGSDSLLHMKWANGQLITCCYIASITRSHFE